jgi:hypothetical protein
MPKKLLTEDEYRALLKSEYKPHEYEESPDHEDCDYCGQPQSDTDFHPKER